MSLLIFPAWSVWLSVFLFVLLETKIPRAINVADLMTHHWTERDGINHMHNLRVVRRGHLKGGAPEGGSLEIMHTYRCSRDLHETLTNGVGHAGPLSGVASLLAGSHS